MEEKFICTTDNFIPDCKLNTIGEVKGWNIYISPDDINKFKIIAHAPEHQYIVYGDLNAECYRFPYAMNQLIENAIQKGANAIVNIKYKINECPKTNENQIIIYGTAVKTN